MSELAKEWQSVENAVPENDDLVLIYADEVGFSLGFYDGGSWYSDLDFEGFTHWQPLPAPPIFTDKQLLKQTT